MQNLGIEWQRFSETARVPTQLDACHFNFKSDEFVTILPGCTVSVSTGFGFRMPNNIGGLIYPIGGFFSQYFPRFLVDTGNVPLRIKIWNFGNERIHIQRGTNICKMLCRQISNVDNVSFFKLNDKSFEPVKNEGSPGWILKSPQDFTVNPNCTKLIYIGITTSGLHEGCNAYVYPYHEYATTNYLLSNNPEEEIYIRISNCNDDESIHISRGDDLGLIALSQALNLHFNVVEGLNIYPWIEPPSYVLPRG